MKAITLSPRDTVVIRMPRGEVVSVTHYHAGKGYTVRLGIEAPRGAEIEIEQNQPKDPEEE